MNNAGIAEKGTSWRGIENWKKAFDVNLFGLVNHSLFLVPRSSRSDLPPQISILNVQQTFVPVGCHVGLKDFPWVDFGRQSMIHQENQAIIVNTGSKQGITNPPYAFNVIDLSAVASDKRKLFASDPRKKSGNPAYNASKAAVKSLTESLAYELRERPTPHLTAHLFMYVFTSVLVTVRVLNTLYPWLIRPGWTYTGLTGADGNEEKPAGAWTPEQTVLYMLDRLRYGEFYILCPDNEVRRDVDRLRIMWAAADITEGRPALSRWHVNYRTLFEEYMRDGLASVD
jgi:NAD(P)-dependent dehydrogenase (short-subunit alcohol dehydrogenase family)